MFLNLWPWTTYGKLYKAVDYGSVGCCMTLHHKTKQLKKLCHHVLVNTPKVELDLLWSSKLVKDH
jgi:hypothetical protein